MNTCIDDVDIDAIAEHTTEIGYFLYPKKRIYRIMVDKFGINVFQAVKVLKILEILGYKFVRTYNTKKLIYKLKCTSCDRKFHQKQPHICNGKERRRSKWSKEYISPISKEAKLINAPTNNN